MTMPLPRNVEPARAAPPAAAHDVSIEQFRGAVSQFATAVSVITTDGPAGRAGMTCSAVCAASDSPPMIVACVHAGSAANPVFRANGVLCVNSLNAGQSELSQMFATSRGVPMEQRFAGPDWDTLATGSPRHRHAVVSLDCEVLDIRELGTHSIFFAKVLATAFGEPATPLIYHRKAYATTQAL